MQGFDILKSKALFQSKKHRFLPPCVRPLTKWPESVLLELYVQLNFSWIQNKVSISCQVSKLEILSLQGFLFVSLIQFAMQFVDIGADKILGGTDINADKIQFLIQWKDETKDLVPRKYCNAFIPEVSFRLLTQILSTVRRFYGGRKMLNFSW